MGGRAACHGGARVLLRASPQWWLGWVGGSISREITCNGQWGCWAATFSPAGSSRGPVCPWHGAGRGVCSSPAPGPSPRPRSLSDSCSAALGLVQYFCSGNATWCFYSKPQRNNKAQPRVPAQYAAPSPASTSDMASGNSF